MSDGTVPWVSGNGSRESGRNLLVTHGMAGTGHHPLLVNDVGGG